MMKMKQKMDQDEGNTGKMLTVAVLEERRQPQKTTIIIRGKKTDELKIDEYLIEDENEGEILVLRWLSSFDFNPLSLSFSLFCHPT